MKIRFTILLTLAVQILIAQNCLPVGITFTTQSQIDSFQINYPDCTEIEGDVLIRGQGIRNLMGLSAIKTTGSLSIRESDNLMSLTGLNNLSSIGTFLTIRNNKSLVNLNGLNNLKSIGGDLEILFCDALINFEGFNNLETIAGNFEVFYSEVLLNFSGLDQLNFIGEDFRVIANPTLENFAGLNNVDSIGGALIIDENDEMVNFVGLEDLSSIGNSVLIESNPNLVDLNGLNNLSSIKGILKIRNNDRLGDLNGLNNLTAIGGELSISGNLLLTSLIDLINLKSIDGIIRIFGNRNLSGLSGLDNIDYTTITGLLLINNKDLSMCSVQSICDFLQNNIDMFEEININGNGCNTAKEIIALCKTVSNIDELDLDNIIHFYPNPTQGLLQVKSLRASPVTVSIFDVTGKLFFRQVLRGEPVINLEHYPSGVYCVSIIDGSFNYVKKVFKN